jgi:hypothetical protein
VPRGGGQVISVRPKKNEDMDIENIIKAIRDSRVRITDHADEETVDDCLTYEEIYFSVIHGEVIEDYPNDKPYPSCLILGRNFSGIPIHSVWAYNPENLWAVLITVYRPAPERWIDYKVRVKK